MWIIKFTKLINLKYIVINKIKQIAFERKENTQNIYDMVVRDALKKCYLPIEGAIESYDMAKSMAYDLNLSK